MNCFDTKTERKIRVNVGGRYIRYRQNFDTCAFRRDIIFGLIPDKKQHILGIFSVNDTLRVILVISGKWHFTDHWILRIEKYRASRCECSYNSPRARVLVAC